MEIKKTATRKCLFLEITNKDWKIKAIRKIICQQRIQQQNLHKFITSFLHSLQVFFRLLISLLLKKTWLNKLFDHNVNFKRVRIYIHSPYLYVPITAYP